MPRWRYFSVSEAFLVAIYLRLFDVAGRRGVQGSSGRQYWNVARIGPHCADNVSRPDHYAYSNWMVSLERLFFEAPFQTVKGTLDDAKETTSAADQTAKLVQKMTDALSREQFMRFRLCHCGRFSAISVIGTIPPQPICDSHLQVFFLEKPERAII